MNVHINETLHSAPANAEEYLASVALPEPIPEKIRALDDRFLTADAALDSARAEDESTTTAWGVARDEHGRIEQRSVDSRSGITAEQLQASAARVKRAAERRAAAMSKVELRIAERATAQKLVADAIKHLKGRQYLPADAEGAGWLHRFKRTSGAVVNQAAPAPIVDVTLVETTLPKGKLDGIVDAQRAAVALLRTERTEIENAYEPAEMVKASIGNQVDALARSARIGVAVTPQSRPKIEWPTQVLEGVTTSRASGNRVHLPDVPALLCRFNREAVLAELFAAVDAAYEGVGKTYEPHERKRKLKRIEAAILEAERIECEAIWEALKAGDTSLRFRPDTNIRALLGIA